jgi:heme-degrading monooxygenase HmoA
LAFADTKDLLTRGRTQLVAARSANTEEAYVAAERVFDDAVKLDAKDSLALLYRGSAKMEHAGWLAQQGKFVPANELMSVACADLDAAVSMSPDNLQVRMTRGLMYGRFPAFLNKGPLGRQDLEAALKNATLDSQPKQMRAQVHLVLGIVYAASGEAAKAGAEFLAVVDANPDGDEAREARDQMKKLAETAPAVSKGPYRPDRFPKIGADVTPVIAAASVTMPGADPAHSPTILKMAANLKTQPGNQGVHVLASADKPGMVVIFTWWKDKQALNQWFYSDAHQGLIHAMYLEHHDNVQAGDGPSQVAIELMTALPGGMRFNGGLTPEAK